MIKRTLIITLSLAVSLTLSAVPAKRGQWRTAKLSNGKEVRIELRGDEFGAWWQAEDGRAYLQETGKESFKEIDLQEFHKNTAPKRQQAQKARMDRRKINIGGEHQPYEGTKKGLIILVEFKNLKFKQGHNLELFNKIIKEKGYTSEAGHKGCVKDYFNDVSYGKFDFDFDVVGPVAMPENYEYYGSNQGGNNASRAGTMVGEACKLVDDIVDFSEYDWDNDGEVEQIFVIYAGLGEADGGDANTIWPHQFFLASSDYGKRYNADGVSVNAYACAAELNGKNKISGIGTICHEFSHCLGLPDAYDTQGDNYGMGGWDIMDQGSYNNDGYVPAGYTSYERWYCGWLEPTILEAEEMNVTGMKALTDAPVAYVLYNQQRKNEYYLIENRQKKGWDEALNGAGLLAIHVDFDAYQWRMNMVNTNAKHLRMTILPADGEANRYNESNDPYPYGMNDSITNNSKPAATLYNKNTDGEKFLNRGIHKIRNYHKDGTISFIYKPSSVTSSSTDPTIPADGIFFHETFDQCEGKGGNDNKWNEESSSDFWADYTGWASVNKFGANKCALFGKGPRVPGIAKSPEITLAGDSAIITFNAAPFAGDPTALSISVTNGLTVTPNTFTLEDGKWTTCRAIIKGNGKTQVNFTPKKRFFLDEVMIRTAKEDTGIERIKYQQTEKRDNRIYSIDGQCLGTDFNALGHGIYIINGKKVVK